MNSGRFPPSGGGSPVITYDDAAGLRQRKTFAEAHGEPYIYDNWKTDIVKRCLSRNYDEERRLLYVAITRAESHVVFTAGDDPNTLLEELPLEVTAGSTDIPEFAIEDDEQQTLAVSIPEQVGPRRHSPHSLMDESVYEEVEDGAGKAFGSQVHDFAEKYVFGEDIDPRNTDEQHIQSLVDSLAGELRPEEDIYLPLETESGRVILYGVIDLLHVTPTSIDIIDFKTDRGRHAEPEYRKQLSVYFHALDELYPDREVSPSILYTETGSQIQIDPHSRKELATLIGS